MASRPATLCNLEKDKMIDCQTGFVDTFNWVKDYINNLKGDNQNIKVDTSSSDHPIIKWIGSFGQEELSASGSLSVIGTDGSSASGSTLTLESAEDANISALVSQDSEGVKITIGAYWV